MLDIWLEIYVTFMLSFFFLQLINWNTHLKLCCQFFYCSRFLCLLWFNPQIPVSSKFPILNQDIVDISSLVNTACFSDESFSLAFGYIFIKAIAVQKVLAANYSYNCNCNYNCVDVLKISFQSKCHSIMKEADEKKKSLIRMKTTNYTPYTCL